MTIAKLGMYLKRSLNQFTSKFSANIAEKSNTQLDNIASLSQLKDVFFTAKEIATKEIIRKRKSMDRHHQGV